MPKGDEIVDGIDQDCDLFVDEGTGTSGGDDEPGPEPGGCGCRGTLQASHAGTAALLVIALVFGLRRR